MIERFLIDQLIWTKRKKEEAQKKKRKGRTGIALLNVDED